jgi:hypothetical protein
VRERKGSTGKGVQQLYMPAAASVEAAEARLSPVAGWSSSSPGCALLNCTCRSLLGFELVMLGCLAVSLPVVYWRKGRKIPL